MPQAERAGLDWLIGLTTTAPSSRLTVTNGTKDDWPYEDRAISKLQDAKASGDAAANLLNGGVAR